MYKVLKPTSICDDFIGDKLDCSNKFLQPSITGIDSHVVIAPLRQWWVRGEKHLWWWGSSEPVGNFSHANRSGFTVFRSNVCLISSHSKGRLNLAGRVGGSIKIKLYDVISAWNFLFWILVFHIGIMNCTVLAGQRHICLVVCNFFSAWMIYITCEFTPAFCHV